MYHAGASNTSRGGFRKLPARLRLRYNLTMKKDSREWGILAAFDGTGTQELSLAQLGETSAVREIVTRMVSRGLLRNGAAPGTYIRTEDGRLELAGPRDVTLYSRPGCHLCKQAKAEMAPLLAEIGARLFEVNIDQDPELRARYDHDVPVILLGARKIAKYRVDLEQLRRQLSEARAPQGTPLGTKSSN